MGVVQIQEASPIPLAPSAEKHPSFRWFVLVVLLALQIDIQAILYAPAAVPDSLSKDLALSQPQLGIVMSVANLAVMCCVLLGSVFVDQLGLRRALGCGILLLGIGSSITPAAKDFESLLMVRIVQGLAMGVTFPAMGASVMEWFSPSEKPYINTLSTSCAFFSVGATFVVTRPFVDRWGHSWAAAFAAYGAVALIMALAWTILGKERDSIEPQNRPKKDTGGNGWFQATSVAKVLRMDAAWPVAIGVFAIACVYQTYFFYLPSFLRNSRGMTANEAAVSASSLPLAGAAGIVAFGLLSTRRTLRKSLLWTSCLIGLIGAVGLILGNSTFLRLGLVVAGFGLGAWLPVLLTYLQSLPRMTPPLLAAFLAIVNIAVYLGGFVAPSAFGFVADRLLSLTGTFALFSCMELLAIAMFLKLPNADS